VMVKNPSGADQACTSRLNGHTAQISHAEAACTW
jgi:hypothetical protein